VSAIHGRAADGDEEDVFLKQFNEAGKDTSVQDSITARLQLCAVKVPDDYPPKFREVAVELLLGMERRSGMNTDHREVGDLIVANGLLTSSLGYCSRSQTQTILCTHKAKDYYTVFSLPPNPTLRSTLL